MLACPQVVGDERRQGRIGAFDKPRQAQVLDLGAARRHIVQKACDRIWDRDTTARGEELSDLVDGAAFLDCSKQFDLIQSPDEIRDLNCVGVESDAVALVQFGADGGDFEVGEHAQDRLRFHGGGLVLGLGAEAVGTKRRDAEVHQPVVAAEVGELVRAPGA
jgi:hypothetical protein